MADKPETPDQTLGDYDLAFKIGTAIVESGLIPPDLRQMLCEDADLGRFSRRIIEVIGREIGTGQVTKLNSAAGIVEYRVHVSYTIPHLDKLIQEFGTEEGLGIFDGRRFFRYSSVDEVPGVKIFCVVQFERPFSSEDAIAEMAKRGYRPASHLELYAWHAFQCTTALSFAPSVMVAIGSSATVGGNSRAVAALQQNRIGSRYFTFVWDYDVAWPGEYLFLFVHKS